MPERLLVEAFQQQIDALLENFAIGLRVEQWRGEGLDLAGVIAPADPHDDPPVGDDVGRRVVFRQADRVPHRQDVEAAAVFELPRLGCQPQPPLDQIGDALVAFVLEMMLGGPERVIAEFVHDPRDVARGLEHFGQALVGIAAVVGRSAVDPNIVEVDLADIEGVKPFDHRASKPLFDF